MGIALSIIFLVVAVLLIMLILIQKGRGAGLAGAFGGAGGHSAFGTKTADVLTKLTAILGGVFFLLAILTALFMRKTEPFEASPGTEQNAPLAPGAGGGDGSDHAGDE